MLKNIQGSAKAEKKEQAKTEEKGPGKKVIIKPNSPSKGLVVAFIEINGAPVELMEYENKKEEFELAEEFLTELKKKA